MKELNYEQDITIDESALDVEWLRQPKLVLSYSNNSSFYERQLSRIKERLEVVKADLDRLIRTDPESYGISKITEMAITNTIITQPAYQELRGEIIECEYELKMSRGALAALNDKKSALENLVKLHGMNYFAGPSVPRDLSQEWQKSAKQTEVNTKISVGGRTRTK